MAWWESLRSRGVDVRALTGALLLATAAALAVSIGVSGWELPIVAFLLVIALALVVVPMARTWYEKEKSRDEEQPFSWTIPIAIVAALIVLTFYRAAPEGSFRSTVITILLIAAAAAVVGVLIGFLFGIPRVAVRQPVEGADDSSAGSLQTNTNLEAISDWLTKIIVGVSLVQADEIVERFDTLLINLARAGYPRPVMGGTIIFFVAAGFLSGYLWTRLVLTRYFSLSERALRETPEYYEGLMNAYLYQPKPQGFRKVIRLFEQYSKRFGQPRHSRVWVYIAAAYGQQYAWMRTVEQKQTDSADLQQIVQKIVESVNSAVASDADSLKLLQSLADEGYDADLLLASRESADVRLALRR